MENFLTNLSLKICAVKAQRYQFNWAWDGGSQANNSGEWLELLLYPSSIAQLNSEYHTKLLPGSRGVVGIVMLLKYWRHRASQDRDRGETQL